MPSNELYLAVLPLVHITTNPVLGYGLTEETLTVFPEKDFATKFFPDEVDKYILAFEGRANKYLIGHVTGYEFHKEPTAEH
jgi:hypothetical protein